MAQHSEHIFAALPAVAASLGVRLQAAVEAEASSEQERLWRLYTSSSLQQLQADGLVLAGLTARPSGRRLFNDTLWEFRCVHVRVDVCVCVCVSAVGAARGGSGYKSSKSNDSGGSSNSVSVEAESAAAVDIGAFGAAPWFASRNRQPVFSFA